MRKPALTLANYATEFKRTICVLPPVLTAIFSLIGCVMPGNLAIEGYIFPPVGHAKVIAGIAGLISIPLSMLIGYTFCKSKRTTLLTIVFSALALLLLLVYFSTWERFVVTVPNKSDGYSRSVAIGSVRTPKGLEHSTLSDEQLLRKEGTDDDRINLYWDKSSTDNRRELLVANYLAEVIALTLSMASVVAGRLREKTT